MASCLPGPNLHSLKPDYSIFVVPDHHAPASDDDGAANQIRILGHQSDRLPAGGWLVLHLLFSKGFAARIQEILVIVFANQLLKFGSVQPVLDQVAIVQMNSPLFHESARLAAGRAGWLLQELDGFSDSFGSCSGFSCRALHDMPHR